MVGDTAAVAAPGFDVMKKAASRVERVKMIIRVWLRSLRLGLRPKWEFISCPFEEVEVFDGEVSGMVSVLISCPFMSDGRQSERIW
jgi:hypothetical protein